MLLGSSLGKQERKSSMQRRGFLTMILGAAIAAPMSVVAAKTVKVAPALDPAGGYLLPVHLQESVIKVVRETEFDTSPAHSHTITVNSIPAHSHGFDIWAQAHYEHDLFPSRPEAVTFSNSPGQAAARVATAASAI
jgi:hypothetical protein